MSQKGQPGPAADCQDALHECFSRSPERFEVIGPHRRASNFTYNSFSTTWSDEKSVCLSLAAELAMEASRVAITCGWVLRWTPLLAKACA